MSHFVSEDQVKANITYAQLFKKLWPYCRRHLWMLSFVALSILGLSLSSRLLNYVIGYAIDHGFLQKDYGAVKTMALIYLAIQIVGTTLTIVYQVLFQKFGNRILFYVREDLIKHLQQLPMSYFNKTPTGRIVTRTTNDVAALGDLFTDGVINVVTEFVMLISIFVAMSFISLKLTLIVLCTAPLFIYLSFRISEYIRVVLREAKKKLSEINSFVAENINGIKVVQLYNRVGRNHSQFQGMSKDYAKQTMKSITGYALMMPAINLFTAVTVTLALYYGGVTSLELGMPIGSLVAFILHTQDFIMPLREILEKYQQFQNSLTSAERVFHLMDEPAEKEQTNPIREHIQTTNVVEVKNLSFQYEPHLPVVLKNVSFEIPQGKTVALVGRTGSGKSTFISLLQRLYSPPEKQVRVFGEYLESIPLHELRSRVGIVQQDNFIFRGTIRENVSLNDPRVSDTRVSQALKEIGYDELLTRTGRTLDSKVEERGANLSAGERQLIAFARILAFQPELLILDEATANIDSQTEKMVQEATRKVTQGRTSLIIAHRLSTIRHADQILVLDAGTLKEKGHHSELMAARGLYYEYYQRGFIDEPTLKSEITSAQPV